MGRSLVLAVAVLAIGADARADAPGLTPPAEPADAAPPTHPRWMLTVGTVVWVTSQETQATSETREVEEYGWVARAAPLWGLRADLAYLQAPLVDVGVASTWARGTYAIGPRYQDPDSIVGSSVELGAFARLHWVRPTSKVAAEPRVEAGVVRTTASLRGVETADAGTYTRIGLDFRLGGRRAGAVFAVDYTSVYGDDDMALALPTGGVTYAVSFYWRQWR
jgi:hypothetical protein